MYTVKISTPGAIVFRGKDVRTPAVFPKVTTKELKFMKIVCLSQNLEYEILEAETERLAQVAQKITEDQEFVDLDEAIDNTDTTVEDLFESDDTLGDLIENLGKE
jgi:hypothetical protein